VRTLFDRSTGPPDSPNAHRCTICNKDVKFEPLLRMARQIGAESSGATGHYARIRKNAVSGPVNACAPATRDRTRNEKRPILFPWGISEGEALVERLFPSASLTKEEVRARARA